MGYNVKLYMEKTVIVIGAGLAGIIAACAAHEEGAEVILIDRGSIGLGTNSALAGGAFTCPTLQYSPQEYIKDTLHTGRMINRESTVRLIAREAPNTFEFLRSMGLHLTEFPKKYSIKPEKIDVIPGVILMKTLSGAVANLERVHKLTGFYATSILKDENHAYGIRGLDKEGKETTIYAPSVVLATGGAGAIYLKNDNQKQIMGQGYYLAAMAGLELWDMEFVQFYPIVLADPHLPSMLVYPPYPKEMRLINPSGENVLTKYDLGDINEAILKKRDEFSEILFKEMLSNPVYMDCRDIPASSWEKYPLTLLAKLKFDFRTKPVLISPATHFFMGGVQTDDVGGTFLPGLFACGEVAWGLHGANRRGGNALTECAVFGKIAGQHAARYALSQRASLQETASRAVPPSVIASSRRVRGNLEAEKSLKELRRQIREVAWEKAGILRSEGDLKEGLAAIDEIDMQLHSATLRNISEKRLKQDLLSACFVLKAVLMASLGRKESRGSFNRKDFPHEDNINWLKNSCLTYNLAQGTFALSYHEVL